MAFNLDLGKLLKQLTKIVAILGAALGALGAAVEATKGE